VALKIPGKWRKFKNELFNLLIMILILHMKIFLRKEIMVCYTLVEYDEWPQKFSKQYMA
jgi:hypothetical protein